VTRLTLAGGYLVTMDPARPVVAGGSVVIEDGQLVDVTEGYVRRGPTIDCRGLVVLPGLVNAHAHALEGLFRGAGGELALVPWIRRTHALMDMLDADGARAAAALATAEMLRGGITTYLDPEVPTDSRFGGMAGALEASGISAGVTLLVEDRLGYHRWSERAAPTITTAESDLITTWQASARVTPWVGPSVLAAISSELAADVRRTADERGLRIAYHCAEVTEDLEDSAARGGGSPVEFAQRIGLLAPGAVLTHCLHVTPTDLALIAAHDASIVHCPASNAKLGSGVAPIVDALEAGVNVALGTDGAVCNDTYDMFREMRLAALLQKAVRRDPGALAPEDVLAMATVNGARALGVPAGRLQPGLRADVTVVDLRRIGTWPTADVVDTLVYAAGRENVVHVVAAGEVLVRDGHLVRVEPTRLLAEAEAVARDAFERSGVGAELAGPTAHAAR
jgi:cytosine/adenosine deaminase-related metal-dependent hydrolase